MKVSKENDKNFGNEKITIVVDNIPYKQTIITLIAVLNIKFAAMSSIMFCIAANTCF
jgi:hypothetical protein